jgi:UDP-galactopyranose mutase
MKKTGVLCNKYGTYIFHTNNEEVWTYINSFQTKWIGTIIMEFIKNQCFNNLNYFNDIGQNIKIIIDFYIYIL